MEDEITNGSLHVELNEDDTEIEMVDLDEDDTQNETVELNENNIENEIEKMKNVEDKVEDPKLGVMFNSIDDVMLYYTRYGKGKGSIVVKRTSKRGIDGETKYVTIGCNRAGKPMIRSNRVGVPWTRSSHPLQLQPQSKTDFKAHLGVVRCPDGKWVLQTMTLDQNHKLSPRKSQFYKCNIIENTRTT